MLDTFISCCTATGVNIFLWNKILDKKTRFGNLRFLIGSIFMLVCLILNTIMGEPILKTLMALIIMSVSIKIIYSLELKNTIILSTITQLIHIVSEVFVIIVILIFTNIQSNTELVERFSGALYTIIPIHILVFCISHFKFVKSFYYKIIALVKAENIRNIFIIVSVIAATTSLIFNLIFSENNLLVVATVSFAALFVYLVFVVKSIKIRNNYLSMHMKYNNTLETLKSYEDILDKYKVSNHENKNQLLMIRNMLKKDTKNAVCKYIDEIVDNQYKDDESLNMETSKIPSGGLRALIYSKLLYMKNNNINFDLKVDRKIRNVQLTDLNQSLILDICKIVGVFLDNSIEEVKKINNGVVSIEIYLLDDKLNVSIANNFEGVVELDKVDELKYTTKGENHGYGLSLVKEIINKNSELENVRMINDDVFIQILKISI